MLGSHRGRVLALERYARVVGLLLDDGLDLNAACECVSARMGVNECALMEGDGWDKESNAINAILSFKSRRCDAIRRFIDSLSSFFTTITRPSSLKPSTHQCCSSQLRLYVHGASSPRRHASLHRHHGVALAAAHWLAARGYEDTVRLPCVRPVNRAQLHCHCRR